MNENLIYKSHLLKIILYTLIFLAFYISVIYIVDPLQQFRVAKFYQPVYMDEMYENPGIAKNYSYDTVIIGTSTSENFRPSYIKQKLGLNAIKLTLLCANSFEEKITLETALQTGKVKNVIFGIDEISFNTKNTLRNGFPAYLYSSHHLNDQLKYLFNIGNIDLIIKIIMGNLKNEHNTLDEAYTWDSTAVFSKENVMRDWNFAKINQATSDNNDNTFLLMKNNFDNNILPIIKSNKNVKFYLFFPPYSILSYKKMNFNDIFKSYLLFKKYIYTSTKAFENVKILDFQINSEISRNLDNYKDMIHYSSIINRYLIDNMNNNKYLVRENNIDKYINKLAEDVNLAQDSKYSL